METDLDLIVGGAMGYELARIKKRTARRQRGLARGRRKAKRMGRGKW